MFTGIVTEQLTIQQIIPTPTGLTMSFSLPQWGKLAVGESILLHGICSTVTGVTNDYFTVDYIAETLRVTTASQWLADQTVHAEPAATLATRLSGGLVTGHVDATGTVFSTQPLTIQLPDQLMSLAFPKGSITINGVNLTITACTADTISLELIPQTLQLTTLGKLQPNDQVNIEADYIAKAVAAVLAARRL